MDQCQLGRFVLTERVVSMKIACTKGKGVSITSLDEDKTLIVSFEGPVLRFDIEPLRETILSKADEGYQNVVLNFENVSTADPAAIALMITVNNVMTYLNTKFYLCHICPVIAGVLKMMGISKVVSVVDTEEEALAQIRQTG